MIYVEFHCLNLALSILTCPNGPALSRLSLIFTFRVATLYEEQNLHYLKCGFITSCSLIQLSDFHYPAIRPCGCLCWHERNWQNSTETICKASCSSCLLYCWSLSRSSRENHC